MWVGMSIGLVQKIVTNLIIIRQFKMQDDRDDPSSK